MQEDRSWTASFRQGLVAGSVASLSSAAALALAGRAAGCGPCAPVAAPSHWIWGEPALRAQAPSLRYTGVGYAIHHASAVMWGVVHARYTLGLQKSAPRSFAGHLAAGAATSALACVVDYRLTPRRLNPGFERHLSRKALFGVYAALAVGFAVASWLHPPRAAEKEASASSRA